MGEVASSFLPKLDSWGPWSLREQVSLEGLVVILRERLDETPSLAEPLTVHTVALSSLGNDGAGLVSRSLPFCGSL